ncbi:hypothetical protein [Micrococcus sp. IITD107]|uniref:hypothetical protein n=1 Tax=Micrococcus sp. IITD107 TaxID=3342790 RepID=UPI0035B7EB5E
MQTNPFTSLLEILDDWWSKNAVVQAQRIGNGRVDWVRHREALEYLFAAEDFISGFEDRAEYEELIRSLWKVVIVPEAKWSQSAVEPLSTENKTAMRSLGRLYRFEATRSPLSLSDEDRECLREALEEMREILGAVPENFHEDRDRLIQMIRECLELLGDDEVDLVKLRARTNEAAGAALPLAVVLSEEDREHFLKAALRATGTWVSNTTAGAVGGVLASGAAPLITGALMPGSS